MFLTSLLKNMKKIVLSLILLILSTQLVLSKEVRTRYGFYVDLPKNYISLSSNLDELIKKDKDNEMEINKKYFNEMMAGSTRADLDIEYFFPKKKYKAEFNNIYITVQDLNIEELMLYSKEEVCNAMVENFTSLWNKSIKLYECKFNPENIDKKNSPGVYYFETDGPYKNQRLHAIMLQMNNGLTSFAAGCETRNCLTFKKDLFKITNSRSE